MWRWTFLVALGVFIGQGSPAHAQPGRERSSIQQLQSELDSLRRQVERMEARLKTLQGSRSGAPRDKDDFKKKMMERFKEKSGDRAKGFDKSKWSKKKGGKDWRGEGRKGPPPWAKGKGKGRGQFGKGSGKGSGKGWGNGADFRRGQGGRGAGSDIDRRLDNIIRELEAIRREAHRR